MIESAQRPSVQLTMAFAACEKIFPLCTTCVTFSLGFFLSTSYARWWKLRDLAGSVLGRTIDTMVMICTYLNGVGEHEREGRRKLARYLLLAHAISLQAGHQSGYRFEKLVELGLLDKDSSEHRALEQATTARYNIAYQWFLSSFYSQLTSGVDIVARGNIMFLVQANVSHMRGGSADIMMYLGEKIPHPITFSAHAITTLYCALLMPVALASQMRWHAAPLAFVVASFFYGLLSAAVAMQDPFHGPLCTFDPAAFLRTTQTACDDLLVFRADIKPLPDGAEARLPDVRERWDDNLHWSNVTFSAPPTPSDSVRAGKSGHALGNAAAGLGRAHAHAKDD